jgi:hypothetical protein
VQFGVVEKKIIYQLPRAFLTRVGIKNNRFVTSQNLLKKHNKHGETPKILYFYL